MVLVSIAVIRDAILVRDGDDTISTMAGRCFNSNEAES
jgi:hypothetical protein